MPRAKAEQLDTDSQNLFTAHQHRSFDDGVAHFGDGGANELGRVVVGPVDQVLREVGLQLVELLQDAVGCG